MNRADDITRMQCHVGQLLADRREQAETERACSMPAGSLAPVEITEGPDDDEIFKVIQVTFNLDTMWDAIVRTEQINFAAARVRHEVAA